jgi:hypothetical protein
MAKFPKAPINEVKLDRGLMKMVETDNGEIGSRPSKMPKDIKAVGMQITHVGGSETSRGS